MSASDRSSLDGSRIALVRRRSNSCATLDVGRGHPPRPRCWRTVSKLSRSQDSSSAPRPVVRRSHIFRSSLLALVTYALGLLPFYFLTPVHDTLPALFKTSSDQPAVVVSNLGRPTPSKAETKKKVGADAVSVVAPTVENAPAVAPLAAPTEAANETRYAFLLLGYGGSGHDGAYLSDSMMVVVVDPDRKTLTLLSIPRDAWVPMTFDGKIAIYNKINTAYAFAQDSTLYPERLARYTGDKGAGTFAADTVSRVVGVPIRYYMGIDFAGFRQMIDAVGGVDVDVPESFAARYPANDNASIDASWITVRFTKGGEHMTGKRAIEFARARETIDNSDEGSDFARSRRQRLIIEAFKRRAIQPGGLIHLPQLIGIASSHIDTNYSVPDAASLSKLALDWKNVEMYQTALTTQNFLEDATGPDGTYAIVPRITTHSWLQVRAFTKRLWSNPALGVAIAQTHITVENDTGVAGSATKVSQILTNLGYEVDAPISGSVRADSRILDSSGRQLGQMLLPALKKDLNLSSLGSVEPTVDPSASLIFQLGSNDLSAATLSIPDDRSAPVSMVGIERFGVWGTDPAVDEAPTAVSLPPTALPIEPKRNTPTPIRGASTATPSELPGRASSTPTRVGSVISATRTPIPVPRSSPTVQAPT